MVVVHRLDETAFKLTAPAFNENKMNLVLKYRKTRHCFVLIRIVVYKDRSDFALAHFANFVNQFAKDDDRVTFAEIDAPESLAKKTRLTSNPLIIVPVVYHFVNCEFKNEYKLNSDELRHVITSIVGTDV